MSPSAGFNGQRFDIDEQIIAATGSIEFDGRAIVTPVNAQGQTSEGSHSRLPSCGSLSCER